MLIVGLTGSLGTGKSTVAAMFKRKGARIIDADRIVHQLICPRGRCYAPVVKAFGRRIVCQGRIDRKELASLVFQNERALKILTDIIHPQVSAEIKKKIQEYRHGAFQGIVVVEVPLLFESGLDRYVDIAMVVTARRRQQIARASRQLKISQEEAARRLRAQMLLKDKIRLADIIIDNSGTKRQTQKQADRIWPRLLQKRKK